MLKSTGQQLKIFRNTKSKWISENKIIPQGHVCFEHDTRMVKVGTGKKRYSELEYAFDALPARIRYLIDNYKTWVVSNDQNVIDHYYFPKEVFNVPMVVETIDDRDNLSYEVLVDSSAILVLDATGDPSVKSGMAFYVFEPTDYSFYKVGEQESIDMDFSDYLKVADTTIDDLADGTTYARLTRADIALANTTINEAFSYGVESFPIESYINRIDITISSDAQNLSLRTLLLENGWIEDSIVTTTFTIESGVTVSSNSIHIPALMIEDMPVGSDITIIHRGTIRGKGGRGANGGFYYNDGILNASNYGQDAEDGGPALKVLYPIKFDNQGIIGSGGGGGGASDRSYDSSGESTTEITATTGGGGAGDGEPGVYVNNGGAVTGDGQFPIAASAGTALYGGVRGTGRTYTFANSTIPTLPGIYAIISGNSPIVNEVTGATLSNNWGISTTILVDRVDVPCIYLNGVTSINFPRFDLLYDYNTTGIGHGNIRKQLVFEMDFMPTGISTLYSIYSAMGYTNESTQLDYINLYVSGNSIYLRYPVVFDSTAYTIRTLANSNEISLLKFNKLKIYNRADSYYSQSSYIIELNGKVLYSGPGTHAMIGEDPANPALSAGFIGSAAVPYVLRKQWLMDGYIKNIKMSYAEL